jgi:U3 small nucleolar ribonucleoprotein protein IMP3
MGIINSKKSLVECDSLSASAFCRRRLGVILVRLNMAESVKSAITMIEQGHVRVGPNVVNDPAMLITRTMQDFVTWVDSSKIKARIEQYNDRLDDYTILGN